MYFTFEGNEHNEFCIHCQKTPDDSEYNTNISWYDTIYRGRNDKVRYYSPTDAKQSHTCNMMIKQHLQSVYRD